MATRAARFTGRLVSTPFDQSMYDSAVGKSLIGRLTDNQMLWRCTVLNADWHF